MTRIVIITRAFPYLPGEQFVEPEAPFWAREGAEVVVMPWRMQGEPRPLPSGIRVDDALATISPGERRAARLRALATPMLWKEVAWLAAHRRLGKASLLEVLRAVGGALAMRDALARWIERNGAIDVVYAYWWDVWTYGAQLLRGKGIGHVVSRAHRYDLYEHMAPARYLALKRSLGPQLDALLPIARDGVRTAVEVYGLDPAAVHLSPLGVALPQELAPTSPAGELHVVSTAAMSPVKRIDRLVDGLARLCLEHPELAVHWTHFGDGELRPELEGRLAEHRRREPGLGQRLTVEMPGNLPNEQLRAHLAGHPADVFVNTSESEGVPVSIMEAMAFGIPALAPEVGGIGELVPAEGPGGQLMSASPDGEEVARVLWEWHERAKQPEQRQAARRLVAASYDRDRNYTGLMDFLLSF